jgi:hypothetical protein
LDYVFGLYVDVQIKKPYLLNLLEVKIQEKVLYGNNNIVTLGRNMKRVLSVIVMINLIFIPFLAPYAGSENGGDAIAKMPGWRTYDIWQYNMTIPSKPGHQTATIAVRGQGSYVADNGKENRSFDTYYITNVNETNEEYGFIYNRTQDQRQIIMYDYTWAISNIVTHIANGTDIKNLTKIKKIIKYDPWIDQYNFPIRVGNSWNQSVITNISTAIYKYDEEGEEYSIGDSQTTATITTYYHCTGIEPVSVILADNEHYYLPNQIVNWSREDFDCFIIKQDTEIDDLDGNYIVEYYNETVGNIVKKEEFKNGELYSTRCLVYMDYVYTEYIDPPNPPDPPGNPYASFFLWAGLGIIIILLGVGIIRIRRRTLEEEGLIREDVMALENRSEFAELCKKMGLSTKGSKNQLKKRLLKYIEEEESKE